MRNKTLKKIVTITLSTILSAGILVGCAAQAAPATSVPEDAADLEVDVKLVV